MPVTAEAIDKVCDRTLSSDRLLVIPREALKCRSADVPSGDNWAGGHDAADGGAPAPAPALAASPAQDAPHRPGVALQMQRIELARRPWDLDAAGKAHRQSTGAWLVI